MIYFFKVSKIFIHPLYDPPEIYHNLAIIRLEESVILTKSSILPICLPNQPKQGYTNHLGSIGNVIGYGDENRSKLQSFRYGIFSKRYCNRQYRTRFPDIVANLVPELMSKDVFCSGTGFGNPGPCAGSTGAPLVVKNGDKYRQIGMLTLYSQVCFTVILNYELNFTGTIELHRRK